MTKKTPIPNVTEDLQTFFLLLLVFKSLVHFKAKDALSSSEA